MVFHEKDYDKYQAGHVLGFFFGGSGELQDSQNNNIVPQVRQLNQGPYNRAEGILRNFVRQMPDGMEVHLNIIVNESIPADNTNSSIPANFRIVWCSSDKETFYRSPLLQNNSQHAIH
jgi:DNA/RNA endonuclease G (NUC1)